MDVEVGQTATRSLTLMQKHVDMYAEMTGGYNPLHFDVDFAAKTKFGGLIVQGGLTTGILNALVAMDMPGPDTVFLSHDFRFTGPVYIGDTVTAMAEVLKVHPKKAGHPAADRNHPPDRRKRTGRRSLVLYDGAGGLG